MTYPIPPLRNDLLLRAINGLPVPRAPVWLMRQAGRADPEYRAYRQRVGLSLFELFRAPEHALPISLLPVRLGVDAVILFQDILTPLAPMGAVFDFTPGPRLAEPIRRAEQVRHLRPSDPPRELPFVGETLRGLRAELRGALPLIGFAGAPFTLAAFMIEGSSPAGGMPHTLAFAREQPGAFGELIERLTDMTVAYLGDQAANGAQVVQLFESVGDLIPRDLYERFAHPSHCRIFAGLPPHVPGVLFVRESPFPEWMLESGAAVLSVGGGVSLRDLLAQGARSGRRIAVQGNVDNRLLRDGDEDAVAAAVRACLAETGGRSHILNLGHGLLPDTPFRNLLRFIQTARETPAPTPGTL